MTARTTPHSASENPTGDLARRLESAAPLVQQDSERAGRLLRTIADEASAQDEHLLEAEAAYLWARAEVNQGHLGAALELIDRARDLWLAAGEQLSAWRTDLGRMHVLDDLGRHAEAIAVGEALVAAVTSASVDPDDQAHAGWLRAAALENIGVGRGYLGQHAQALDAYSHAEQAYRDLGMAEEVARPLGNRGVELVELGRFAEAVETLQSAAGGFEANADTLFAAKCLAYEARAHVMLGNHLEAAAATKRAEHYLSGLATTTEYARTQLVRAENLRFLNLLEESLGLYESLIPQLSDAGLRHDLADARYGAGLVLAQLGLAVEARKSLASAEELFEAVGSVPMQAACLVAQAELAEPVEARRLAETALGPLIESGRLADLAAAHIRLAQVAPSWDQAEDHLLAARATLRDHGMPELEWRLLREEARWHRRQGDSDRARSLLLDALDIIDRVRTTVADEHHRLPFMGGRSTVIDDIIDLELSIGEVASAYAHAEQARARTLVERISGELAGSTPSSTVELDQIYTELLGAPSTMTVGLRARARSIESQALGSAPTTLTKTASVGRPEVDTGAMVTYHAAGDELLAFVHVDDDLTVVRELASISHVRHLMAQLDAQWRRFDDPGLAARQRKHLLASTLDVLQQLHIQLVAGLPHVLDADSVLVVPCAPLANVPFTALHDGTCHLVERLTLTLAPSRSVARHAAQRMRSTHARRLALAVPDADTPNVVDEVNAVAQTADQATVLVGNDATVDSLHTHAASNDVLHLACHGVHRPDNPLFSALRLGDRWLTAGEVAALHLDGQLVVLSACSSGRQFRSGDGDELVGLPRAFLAAGAGGIVVNLWQVDDESARRLMTRFHERLRTETPAAALRSAQLQVMSDHPHPYHWAPAVMYGAPRPKEQQ